MFNIMIKKLNSNKPIHRKIEVLINDVCINGLITTHRLKENSFNSIMLKMLNSAGKGFKNLVLKQI